MIPKGSITLLQKSVQIPLPPLKLRSPPQVTGTMPRPVLLTLPSSTLVTYHILPKSVHNPCQRSFTCLPVLVNPPFPSRTFASKNRMKDKKGPKVVEIPSEEMEQIVPMKEYDQSLRNLVEEFREQLSKQFSLRTSSASFDSISVEVDGRDRPLNEVAQISFKTPQMIMINLSATPTYVHPVLKALDRSGLNLNPQTEGHMIYIPVPKVSREHRETLAKNAKAALNKFKERLRRIQNTTVSAAKAKPDLPEDLLRNAVLKLMERAESASKELDAALTVKQKELLNTDRE